MKLHKNLLLFGASALLLVACGDGGSTEDTATDTDASTDEVGEVVETENDDSLSEGNSEETEYGTLTRVVSPFEVNETQSSGPFDVTVKKAQIGFIEPTEDYVELFGGEEVTIVSLLVEAKNNSEDTNSIYPDQGTIVTNTGHQIDADMLFSGSVGGDFLGEVTKEDEVWFFLNEDPSEITNIRYFVDSGHDEDWDNFGENLEFSIDF